MADHISKSLFSTALLFFALVSSAAATAVPTVALCKYSSCPNVSRIGLGTLHLNDSISGISTAQEVNSWIQHAVSIGITLFDLADVYPVKGGTGGTSTPLFGEALALTPGLREQLTLVAKMDIIFPSSVDTTDSH